jgi:hypothetical protein
VGVGRGSNTFQMFQMPAWEVNRGSWGSQCQEELP